MNVNYPGLRTLYEKYKDQGFNVLAFPCNQFGGQAPLPDEEEREFAIKKFGFDFDVFDKIDVNGPDAHPLYKFLKARQPLALPASTQPRNSDVSWNYTKFIVDRAGQPVKRYKSKYDPADFEGDIRLLLAGKEVLPAKCLRGYFRECDADVILGTEDRSGIQFES